MFSRNRQQASTTSLGADGTPSLADDGQLRRSLPGHPGNLSQVQAEALRKFCEELTRDKLYVPPSPPGGRASHTDATLLWVLTPRVTP